LKNTPQSHSPPTCNHVCGHPNLRRIKPKISRIYVSGSKCRTARIDKQASCQAEEVRCQTDEKDDDEDEEGRDQTEAEAEEGRAQTKEDEAQEGLAQIEEVNVLANPNEVCSDGQFF
jgi:uncharacterized protein YabE (DUF348 family)